MHLRKEIKQFYADLFKNKTTAQDRVFPNRFIPVGVEELPAIVVYVTSEAGGKNDTDLEKKVARLIIEGTVDGYNADEDLDDLENEIQALMLLPEAQEAGINATSVEWKQSEIGVDETAQSTVQAVRISYDVTYFVEAVAPAPTDALLTAEITEENGAFTDSVDFPQ